MSRAIAVGTAVNANPVNALRSKKEDRANNPSSNTALITELMVYRKKCCNIGLYVCHESWMVGIRLLTLERKDIVNPLYYYDYLL